MKREIKDRIKGIKNGGIPEGYTKTRYGTIPKDWNFQKLSSLIESGAIIDHLDGNHGALYPRQEEFTSNGVPYISANSVINGQIDFKMAKFLTQERANKFSKGVAKNNDVLFAHNATVGPVALLKTREEKVILSTSLTYYRCNKKQIIPKYLVQFMQSSYFKIQYESIMSQTTRNQVPITLQRDLYHIIPPLQEQQKIATILSTWDKAIELKEKLIEEKKKQKRGLMQKLLSGKVRLPGFDEEWKEVKLGDMVSEIIDNRGKTPPVTTKGYELIEVAVLEGDNIYPKYEKVIKFVDELTYNTWFRNGHPKKGDILIATVGSVGLSAIMGSDRGTIAQNIIGLRINEVYHKEFIYFIINSRLFESYIRAITMGAVQPSIKVPQLLDFKFRVPGLEESIDISNILLNSNRDITLHQQELQALKLQKKGLMQLLLTGIVRVNTEN